MVFMLLIYHYSYRTLFLVFRVVSLMRLANCNLHKLSLSMNTKRWFSLFWSIVALNLAFLVLRTPPVAMVTGKVQNRISIMSSINFVPECSIQYIGNICEFVSTAAVSAAGDGTVSEGLVEAVTSWPPFRTQEGQDRSVTQLTLCLRLLIWETVWGMMFVVIFASIFARF